MAAHDLILIIDFGSQVTQLIARRFRELHFYCEIHPHHKIAAEFLAEKTPKAIILSGGPESVLTENASFVPEQLFMLDLPVLGICYGQQLMVKALGGEIAPSHSDGKGGEFGKALITRKAESPLLDGLFLADHPHEQVWMSHGDHVSRLPEGFHTIATSKGAPFAVIEDKNRHFYGVQFHPEVIHTLNGTQILRNFCQDIAGATPDWTMENFRDEAIRKLKAQIGDAKVICGLSGGVDSSVTAILLHKAIGDQLTCVFVDTGLLRAGEAEQVISLFQDHYKINLRAVNAAHRFYEALGGETDPEAKRKKLAENLSRFLTNMPTRSMLIFWPKAPSIRMLSKVFHRMADPQRSLNHITMSAACRKK